MIILLVRWIHPTQHIAVMGASHSTGISGPGALRACSIFARSVWAGQGECMVRRALRAVDYAVNARLNVVPPLLSASSVPPSCSVKLWTSCKPNVSG